MAINRLRHKITGRLSELRNFVPESNAEIQTLGYYQASFYDEDEMLVALAVLGRSNVNGQSGVRTHSDPARISKKKIHAYNRQQ